MDKIIVGTCGENPLTRSDKKTYDFIATDNSYQKEKNMDGQKLLEYAQYGCAQKMNDYRILAEKAGSAIKADTAYTLYQQAQNDCREINRMIAEK